MSPTKTLFGRPKILPQATIVDLLIEIVALAGLIVNLALVAYGLTSLPAAIPIHVSPSGEIDSYGSKWLLLTIFFGVSVAGYILLTVLNKYPYWFSYPAIVTDNNALRLYRMGTRLLRWLKLIILWMFAALAFWFIVVLPDDPGLSSTIPVIVAPYIILLILVLVYYVRMMIREGNRN